MFQKNQKLKIVKNRNYLLEAQNPINNFPSLYNESLSINKLLYKHNNNEYNKYSKKLKKNFTQTSPAFLERNYKNYLTKIYKKKFISAKAMMQEQELNSLLYKLKKYNNQLVTYNNDKNNKIQILKKNLKQSEARLKKLQELQDIDLPYEKISINNFNEIKLSKENIEKQLYDLIDEKKRIDYSLKNEEEYNKTIEYMLEEEQSRLFSIKRDSHNIEEKLLNLKKYQKIVSDNMTLDNEKEENFVKLKQQILSDIQLVEDIKENQDLTNEQLQEQINKKENEIKVLELEAQKLKDYKNNEIQISKDKLKDEIENAKEIEKKRINDEKKCIEIIYCLYIIQKYFYEENQDIKGNLTENKDYQLLVQLKNEEKFGEKNENKKIIKDILNKNNNKDIEKYDNNIDEENTSLKESKIQINPILSSTHINNKINTNITSIEESKLNNTTKDFHKKATLKLKNKNKTQYNNKSNSFKRTKYKTNTNTTFFNSNTDINSFSNDINNLNEIITKFKSIKLTKNQISDFISKLLNKLDFYRFQLNNYRYKEINLEEKKSKYESEVKNIISNNFYDFEEFAKNNQKIKNFISKNEFFINDMKKKYKKIQRKKIIEKINKKEEIDLTEDNNTLNLNSTNYDNDITENNIVFKTSKALILQIKNFFLKCSDLLKDIITYQKYKPKKSSNITEDKIISSAKTEEDNETFLKENTSEEENNTNPYVRILKKIIEFQKNKDIEISNDYKLLLQYIKNLIKFCQENNSILSNEDLEDIKLNLIDKFYKSGNAQQKPDKVFIKRFFVKNAPNFNNIFIHFMSLSDQVIDIVKAINDLIISDTNNNNEINIKFKINNEIFLDDNNNINNINLLSPKKDSVTSINNNESQSSEAKSIKSKKKIIKKYKKLKTAKSVNLISTGNEMNNKFQELCADDEDNESVDTQSTKKIILKKKRKTKSLDDKIINKLYTPFLEKNQYLRKLNPNIPGIKQMTSSSSKVNHELKKIIGKVNITTHQMQIYNNPILNINKLSNSTYNSLVKLIYDNTHRSMKKTGKKLNYV